ncbi:hypothetical protein [Nocardia grenadensis]|uniref:hypothetical protein n=1 Tax=Nocardia grenadensis TaxID=931537 RepID=UPI003D716DD5
MRYIHPLAAATDQPADVLGAKAYGLIELRRLGLPVPADFVVGTECPASRPPPKSSPAAAGPPAMPPSSPGPWANPPLCE